MVTVSFNSLTDAVFIANRRAEFHTATYAVLGVVKLILPLFLIPFGSMGIYMAYILAVVASLLLSLFFMRRSCGYRFKTKPNWKHIKQIRKYASNNYFSVILGGLPSQLLPLVIIHKLGSAQAAYFSMAWMMANLLYVVPTAATQSLLAERLARSRQQAPPYQTHDKRFRAPSSSRQSFCRLRLPPTC